MRHKEQTAVRGTSDLMVTYYLHVP